MIVVVASCNGFSDAWTPFAQLFNLFWKDCPYRRVILSTEPDPNVPTPGFEKYFVTEQGWCRNLLECLMWCQLEQTVLLLQEDFFVCSNVDGEMIARLDEWLRNSAYDAVRLMPCPGADGPKVFPHVGVITDNAPYRISCQATIWKIPSLINWIYTVLGNSKGTIQCFEGIPQHSQSLRLAGWYRDTPKETWPFSYHVTAIVRGKWQRGAVELARSHGVEIPGNREIVD